MTRAIAAFVLALGSLLIGWAGPALAQDAGAGRCPEPPLPAAQEVIPIVGARQVSLDAPLRVRYTDGYFEPGGPGGDPATLVTVERCPTEGCDMTACEEDGDFVPGRAQVVGDELVFFPDGGWEPDTTYAGVGRGRHGDREFAFCTGTADDDAAPTLGALDSVTSTVAEPRCEAPDGGFRIAVRFAPAVDPGAPPGSIEYFLFQTRGTGVDGPILRDQIFNYATTGEITMSFNLPPEEAATSICVRVAAIDGVGNVTFSELAADGTLACVEPVQGNFFEPLCAVSAPGAGPTGLLAIAAAGLVALIVVVRRRR